MPIIGRLPYGKDRVVALPSTYQLGSWKKIPVFDNAPPASLPDNAGFIAHIPLANSVKGSESTQDDRTEFIGRHADWKTLHETTGFPLPVPKIPGPLRYAVRKTSDGMGLGVFAPRSLDVQEVVLRERPVFVMPPTLDFLVPDLEIILAGYSDDQHVAIGLAEEEQLLEFIVHERLEPRRALLYQALANAHTEDGSGKLTGIVRSNAFATAFVDTPVPLELGYCVVGLISSRINHSCRPNVSVKLNKATFALEVKATRPIKKGEQLFCSYCDLAASAEARRRELAPYGFECRCLSCVNATPESDRFRETHISELTKLREDVAVIDRRRGPPLKAEVGRVYAFKKKLEEEGLDQGGTYAVILGECRRIQTKLGLDTWDLCRSILKYGDYTGPIPTR